MALPPVSFSVPSFSLPSRQQSSGGPLDDIVGTAISAMFQEQLQEASFNRQADLSRELQGMGDKAAASRAFADAVIRGEIQQVPTDGPEDVFGSLDRIQAPEGVEGSYVRVGDVKKASPFTQYMGREVKEGTKYGDVTGPNGDIDPRLASGVAKGDIGKLEALVAAIPQGAGASVRQAAQGLLAAAKRDSFFSAAEEDEMIGQGLTLTAMDGYEDSVRAYRELDRETQANIMANRGEIARKLVVREKPLNGPATDRELTPAERDAYANSLAGRDDLNSPAMKARVDELHSLMIPRVQAPDIQEATLGVFSAAGNPSTVDHNDFVAWMTAYVLGPKGEVLNETVAKDIRTTTGGNLNPDAIKTWATHAGPSASYRAAYALHANGYGYRSAVQNLEAQGLGKALPFSLKTASDAFAKLDPSFNDTPDNSVGYQGDPGDPLSGEGLEAIYGEVNADFGAMRNNLQKSLQGTNPVILRNVEGTMLGDDMQQIADSLANTSQSIRKNAARLTGPEKASAEALAAYYEKVSAYAQTEPSRFKIWRDSVFLPTVRNSQR